jgi:SAM-dependent methyltransferase
MQSAAAKALEQPSIQPPSNPPHPSSQAELPAPDLQAAAQVCCPVCASPCSEAPLYRYTVAQAAAHFCPTTRDVDRNRRLRNCIASLWNGDECVILRCGECGFAFGSPFVSGDEEFYSLLHEQKDYPTWRWDYDVALREAVGKFAGGRIVDLGAGVGMFLRRLGPQWERFGVEGSESTRQDLERLGVKVFRDLATAAHTEAGTFQVVTLFQVLEHIAEFDLVLKFSRQLLMTGGRLVITVPDGEAMIRQQLLTGCHDMPPNHVNKWSYASLSRVLERAGFSVSEAIGEPASWRHLKSSLHLKVAADATNEQSLAAQVYRIRSRGLRRMALSALGLPALFAMWPHISKLRQGGAFGVVAVAR